MNISHTNKVDTEDKTNDEATHEVDVAQSTKDGKAARSATFDKAYLGMITNGMFKKRRLS